MALVSVVLIFLDAERFLAEAIESVLVQTLDEFELILVDDGSSDGSSALAQQYAAADPRVRYLDHQGHANLGRSVSRNAGAAESRGEYLAFQDADDVWDANKLAEQLAILQRNDDLALVCGAMVYWRSWNPADDRADRTVLTGGVADRRLDPPEAALRLYPLGAGAGAGVDVLVRRSVFEEVGGFEDRFDGLYDDQAFLLKVFLRYPIFISARPWLWYRQHDASCCATSTRSPAEYRRLRGIFLNWVEGYLRVQPSFQPQVVRALRQAKGQLRRQAARDLVRGALRRLRRITPAS